MKDIKFNKKCNLDKLKAELIAAGFDIYGCSGENDDIINFHETTVHLKDTEMKNPTAIVNNHIYTDDAKPKTEKETLLELLKDADVKAEIKKAVV